MFSILQDIGEAVGVGQYPASVAAGRRPPLRYMGALNGGYAETLAERRATE